MRKTSSRRPDPGPALAGRLPRPEVSEADRRAILGVADCLIGRAGRTTLVMALRGSRAKRVCQFGAQDARGYGHFAGVPETEVLARVDALIAEKILRLEYRDGLPLLGYTDRGLQEAMRFAAEEWLAVLRTHVRPVAEGAPLELPFLMSVMPQRNHDTVFLVIELATREADVTWLPLLRAWSATETRRGRERLAPVIAALERPKSAGDERAKT